jgi:predicted DNA binding CopG/RHH family protein
MKSTGKKFDYGDKDLLDENEFANHNVKVRITTMVDLDVLNAIKARAEELGRPYQTLLNEALSKMFLDGPKKREPDLTDKEKREVRELIAARSRR